MAELLQIKDLKVSVEDKQILKGIDLTIKKGERIGQGIFYKVPKVSYGVRLKGDKRGGGFGSTNRSK